MHAMNTILYQYMYHPHLRYQYILPCSVFVATHSKMNTLGVSHVPCLLHKVPFQFIRVLNGGAHLDLQIRVCDDLYQSEKSLSVAPGSWDVF